MSEESVFMVFSLRWTRFRVMESTSLTFADELFFFVAVSMFVLEALETGATRGRRRGGGWGGSFWLSHLKMDAKMF